MSRGRAPWAAALTVLAVGLWAAGSGFLNGDAAVYAWQAEQGILDQRIVHVGWILLARGVFLVTGAARLPWALDAVNALAAAVLVLGVARAVGPADRGQGRQAAAWVATALVLPWAGHAEVDVSWAALAAWAVVVRSSCGSAALAFLALCVSPAVLLATPILLSCRWARTGQGWRAMAPLLIGVGTGVLLLTLVSGGDWWIGDRGVLRGPTLLPGRTLSTALTALGPALAGGLLVAGPARWGGASRALLRLLPASVPLLLAPPDVPVWLVLALPLGAAWAWAWPPLGAPPTPRGPARRAATVLLALVVLVGGLGAVARQRAVATEEARIAAIAAELAPGDVVTGSWSRRVRVSLRVTGDPYGL